MLKFLFIGICVLLGGTILFFACGGPVWQKYVMNRYDRDIRTLSRKIEAVSNDASRARAYSKRAGVYSEKARYGRMFKLVTWDEYLKLFDLAVADHNAALQLSPDESGLFFARGMTYYNRATAIDM